MIIIPYARLLWRIIQFATAKYRASLNIPFIFETAVQNVDSFLGLENASELMLGDEGVFRELTYVLSANFPESTRLCTEARDEPRANTYGFYYGDIFSHWVFVNRSRIHPLFQGSTFNGMSLEHVLAHEITHARVFDPSVPPAENEGLAYAMDEGFAEFVVGSLYPRSDNLATDVDAAFVHGEDLDDPRIRNLTQAAEQFFYHLCKAKGKEYAIALGRGKVSPEHRVRDEHELLTPELYVARIGNDK